MRFNDDILMRFADGELPEDEAAQVREAMADDRELRARIERFRYVRRALKDTYDSVAKEPIPERFHALLSDMATSEAQTPQSPQPPAPAAVVSLSAAREARAQRVFTPPVWAAMAASVMIGLFAGSSLMRPSSLLAVQDGQLRAGPALAQVLDTRLASDAANTNAALHIGVSFRAQDGSYCRTFDAIQTQKAVSGLACRQSDAWVVRIATTEAGVASDYRQAGSAAPAVMNMVDTLIAGDPFTDAQERAAREHSWKN